MEEPIAPTQANTKLPPEMAADAKKMAEVTGLRMADLLRIGLRRLIAEFQRDGQLTLKATDTEEA